MAVQSFVPIAQGAAIHSAISTTSSGEIVIGLGQVFVIVADNDCFIRFGNAGMGAAVTTDFYLPAKTPTKWDMGSHADRIRVISSADSKNLYIQPLSKS